MNERILNDLKDAMKAQDKFKLSVLRMLKSALQMEAINNKAELTDDNVIKVIKKQVKLRKDSISEYQKCGKMDTVEDLNNEIAILEEYLPEEMSIEEVKKCIDEVFAELNPSSIKDMGSVMKRLGEKITNADMKEVSRLVKEKLSWLFNFFYWPK